MAKVVRIKQTSLAIDNNYKEGDSKIHMSVTLSCEVNEANIVPDA